MHLRTALFRSSPHMDSLERGSSCGIISLNDKLDFDSKSPFSEKKKNAVANDMAFLSH